MRLLRSALLDLNHNRLRSVLSAFTLFLGIVCIVGTSAVSSMATDMLIATEEQKNGRAATYTISLDPGRDPGIEMASSLQAALTAQLAPAGAVTVSTERTMFLRTIADVDNNRAGSAFPVAWSIGDPFAINRVAIVEGASPFGREPLPPSLVINESAASMLNCHVPCEYVLSPGNAGPGALFRIVGIVADGRADPMGYGDLRALGTLFPLDDLALVVRVTGPDLSQSRVTRAVSDAAFDRSIAAEQQATRTDTTQEIARQVSFLQAIFTGFSLVLLLVAAVGLLNVGMAAIRERSRELVIRRAIGATRRDVVLLVVVSTLVLTVSVALLATSIAIAVVVYALPRWIPSSSLLMSPQFPVEACVLGIASGLCVALLASALPALKASRLPVAQALRE